VAMPFDPNTQLSGGVPAGPVVSSRSEYLEQNVRTQQSLLGLRPAEGVRSESRTTDFRSKLGLHFHRLEQRSLRSSQQLL